MVVVRVSTHQLREAAELAVISALREIGATAAAVGGEVSVTTPDGRSVPVAIKAASVVTAQAAREWTKCAGKGRTRDMAQVVVADAIDARAREVLRRAGWGWLDRRGDLRVVGPGVWIERSIPPLPRRPKATGRPLRGASGIAVASAHLLWPSDPPGVRELGRRVGLSGAAISTARAALVDAGLLSASGQPAVPDLFRVLADAWRPSRIALSRMPDPHPESGLVATGTRAALAMGAPLLATEDFPLDLLAADERSFQRARLTAGEAFGPAVATLALAPTPLATDPDVCGDITVEGFPVTAHLFVALELASDPARGAEALEAWRPEGVNRVW